MRFWDSSALVPLFVSQETSGRMSELYGDDPDVLVWALSDVELRSAFSRLAREAALSPAQVQNLARRCEAFWETVHVVSLTDPVKARAKRLLNVHPLRAADALQLGAALAVAGDDPLGIEFVCLDQRLVDAAHREGFAVLA